VGDWRGSGDFAGDFAAGSDFGFAAGSDFGFAFFVGLSVATVSAWPSSLVGKRKTSSHWAQRAFLPS
jgi:hypothetical protein